MHDAKRDASDDGVLDAIVIGGGAAGLAATYHLQALNVLTLEKEAVLGGRIQTRGPADVSYDMGAVFAYSPDWLPFSIERPAIHRERGPIGILDGEDLVTGSSFETCLDQMALSAVERSELDAFKEGRIEAADLSSRTYMTLNGHFKVIYPADMTAYARERESDALITSTPDHYVEGNGSLIDALAHRIKSPVVTSALGQQVETRDNDVLVTYRHGEKIERRRARIVIVATPAHIARRLIDSISASCSALLDCVRYGRFTVVAIGLEFSEVPGGSFSYVITPMLSCNSILWQRTGEPRKAVMMMYFGEPESDELHQRADSAIVKEAISNLRALPESSIKDAEVLFTDVQRWNPGGGVLTEEHLGRVSPKHLCASDRIFLAGDYTHDPFPFGINAALNSGHVAAAMAMHTLLQKHR